MREKTIVTKFKKIINISGINRSVDNDVITGTEANKLVGTPIYRFSVFDLVGIRFEKIKTMVENTTIKGYIDETGYIDISVISTRTANRAVTLILISVRCLRYRFIELRNTETDIMTKMRKIDLIRRISSDNAREPLDRFDLRF